MVIPSDITRWGFEKYGIAYGPGGDPCMLYKIGKWSLYLPDRICGYRDSRIYVKEFAFSDDPDEYRLTQEVVDGPRKLFEFLTRIGYLAEIPTNDNKKTSPS